MPYFAWKGVNIKADYCKGALFAQDEQELDALLLKKDIALIRATQKKPRSFCPLPAAQIMHYLEQVTMLLRAGMLLPNSLQIVARQTIHLKLAQASHMIADDVGHGISFAQALQKHRIFEPLMIQMAAVGQESGTLVQALEVLNAHLASMQNFKARLRAAVLLPIVTFIFFIAVVAIIMVTIVPQFAMVFSSLHKQVPASTRMLLEVSSFLQSGWMLLLSAVVLSFLIGLRFLAKTKPGKTFLDACLLKVPLIKTLIVSRTLSSFFHAISLLLEGGIPLVKAIAIAKESVGNGALKKQLTQVMKEVSAGSNFSTALAAQPDLCQPEIVSLSAIGQEAGNLASISKQISYFYQQRMLTILNRINALFAPSLLLILGLLITGLIVTVYGPILNLSAAL